MEAVPRKKATKAMPRRNARRNLHKSCRKLVVAQVQAFFPPRDGKPAFGFANTITATGTGSRSGIRAIFNDRYFHETFCLGGTYIHAPLDMTRFANSRRGGHLIFGEIEPSPRKGGRASHVFSWWAFPGKQIETLATVVLKGTGMASQALEG